MTVATGNGGSVAIPEDDDMLGFEDSDSGDLIIPRLSILHKEGLFVDSLSKRKFETLDVIILGRIKQRIMWKKETDEGDKPLCKSPDHALGFPFLSDDVGKDKRFPWPKSGLDPADYPADQGVNGLVTLPCASCKYKEWDISPDQKKPLCSEQFTFPLIYSADDWETSSTALYTVMNSGITPAKTYVSGFIQRKMPMFKVFTRIGLKLTSKNAVDFSVPTFAQMGETDRDQWLNYADSYRSIRGFVREAPKNYDEETTPGDNTNTPAPTAAPAARPAPAAAPVRQAPAPAPAAARPAPAAAQPAPVVTAPEPTPDDDDDLPF